MIEILSIMLFQASILRFCLFYILVLRCLKLPDFRQFVHFNQSNSGFKLLTLSEGMKMKQYNVLLSRCSPLVVRRGNSCIINLEEPGIMQILLPGAVLGPVQAHAMVDVLYRITQMSIRCMKYNYGKYFRMYF